MTGFSALLLQALLEEYRCCAVPQQRAFVVLIKGAVLQK